MLNRSSYLVEGGIHQVSFRLNEEIEIHIYTRQAKVRVFWGKTLLKDSVAYYLNNWSWIK